MDIKDIEKMLELQNRFEDLLRHWIRERKPHGDLNRIDHDTYVEGDFYVHLDCYARGHYEEDYTLKYKWLTSKRNLIKCWDESEKQRLLDKEKREEKEAAKKAQKKEEDEKKLYQELKSKYESPTPKDRKEIE